MTVEQARAELKELQLKQFAYRYGLIITSLDANTYAPKGSAEGRATAMSIMSGEMHKLFAGPQVGELLGFLNENKGELTPEEARQVELLKRSYDNQSKIPLEETIEYSKIQSEAEVVWHEAKEQSDFKMFLPYLEKIVAYQRKFAGYYDPNKKPYDALLNLYERGADMEMLDKYFATIRSTIVPLLAKTQGSAPIDDSFLYKYYDPEQQKKLSLWLMNLMGLNDTNCAIAETEHPFTTGTDNHHARITTHYYPNAVTFAMYSTIHEGGHALYELGVDDKYRYTTLDGGVSMGIHESQSRFYENIVGRSQAFTNFIFPKMAELFPEQFKGITPEHFYRAVNKAQPSLIRTEADELTYSLHVLVRYEIEKLLIDGSLAVKDVPGVWNKMYKEYIGIDVPSDKEGCLQDSHWSGGSFGYFPSYSLGSAYGAQMLETMKKTLDIDACCAKGEIAPITAWLREHIHKYGCMLDPSDVVKNACVAEFDPTFYANYLTKKFSALYNL